MRRRHPTPAGARSATVRGRSERRPCAGLGTEAVNAATGDLRPLLHGLALSALVAASSIASSIASVARADGTMPSVSAAAADCTAEERVDERFANGARWELCVESRVRENLVLKHVTYTPPGGEPFPVLASASLAQLHVAYDDNDVTYNDITQYGLGGGYLVELDEADCPYGTLMTVRTRAAICRWRRTGADGYRSAARALEAESVNLFSVSQVGAYAYVQSWTFRDDGAIEPGIGASGALQRSANDPTLPFGRVLSGDPDTLWLSHTHNYHWRLDFDVGAMADDDVVTETRHPLGPDGRRARERIRFEREAARVLEPDALQAWHVWEEIEKPTVDRDLDDGPGDGPGDGASGDPDGDVAGSGSVAPAATATDVTTDGAPSGPRGYRIEPERAGHRFVRTDVEPHTGFDLFVTVARDCERFASQNARYEPDCLNDVLQYADAEPLDGADIVLWHRVGFHHVPRDEDQRHMHTHWDGFTIEPVNLSSGEVIDRDAANTPPELPVLAARAGTVGDAVDARLEAIDADGGRPELRRGQPAAGGRARPGRHPERALDDAGRMAGDRAGRRRAGRGVRVVRLAGGRACGRPGERAGGRRALRGGDERADVRRRPDDARGAPGARVAAVAAQAPGREPVARRGSMGRRPYTSGPRTPGSPPMKQALVVTVVGPNRPGIVGRLADVVAARDADWLESHMADLAGQFAGIVHVEVEADRHAALVADLEGLREDALTVTIADGEDGAAAAADVPAAGRTLTLELTGLDHPGIVRDIGAALAAHRVDVRSLETERVSGSMSGEMLFVARAELALPDGLSLDALEAALHEVSAGMMVDVELDAGD